MSDDAPSSGRSRLEKLLRSGEFVLTAELGTSDSADPAGIHASALALRGAVDAVNCTDNPGANVHLSPLAAARLLLDAGVEPIMQLTCRDRNRLALQSDLLGAAALGVRNVLLMSGDDVRAGDHPEAKPVYEIDSLQLVRIARIMRDQGTYLSGRKLDPAPSFFIGAVENPFAPPFDFRPHRLAKKIEAGAQFIQTQLVFNLPRFREFMARVVELGLHRQAFILASVGVPRSARAARFMQRHVPGLDVPDEVVTRLERAGAAGQETEGLSIAAELAARIREIPGVSGLHLIAIKWEEGVIRLIERAALPRRQPALAPA